MIFHIAEPDRWAAAQASGSYAESTRGMTLEQQGFIHAAEADQVGGVLGRFYADVGGPLLLLGIDEDRLAELGVPVRREPPADGIPELFPHLYAALPVRAVVEVRELQPPHGA